MKKFLVLGLSAVAVALATSRPADAWINCKFSAGINFHYQSGNNCLLWGLFRNGDIPHWYGHYPQGAPAQASSNTQYGPWYGGAPQTNQPTASVGQPYSTASYSGWGNDFSYYPASYGYQGNNYYGAGYGSDQFMWFYQP